MAAAFGNLSARVVPPIVVVALALLIWELLCRRAGSTLPPPSCVLEDTWELIVDPFFDRGDLDKGLFRHLSAIPDFVIPDFADAPSGLRI